MISSTGNLNLVVNDLKEKARTAFYRITNPSNKIFPFESGVKYSNQLLNHLPYMVVTSEVWDPLANQYFPIGIKAQLKHYIQKLVNRI